MGNHKTKPIDNKTGDKIYNAIVKGDLKTFTKLVDKCGQQIANHFFKNVFADIDDSPFLLCATYGRYEMMQLLLHIPIIDVNQHGDYGFNALTNIIVSQQIKSSQNGINCAKLLLSHPLFQINSVDIYHRTSLSWAAGAEQQFEILKLLLKHKETDVNLQDRQGMTPIFFAPRKFRALNIRLLLRHPHVHVNAQNSCGDTLLIHFASYWQDESSLQFSRQLLNHPDINVHYVANTNNSAQSLTLHRQQYLIHAMLVHGRI